MSLLITNTTILTVDAENRVIKDGAVYVEDGRIAAVGPSAEIGPAHAGAARIIDGAGKVVLPGFVSTHNHVGYTFFRGRAEDMGLGCVTGQYFPMATVASREERLAVGSLTYAELLKSGVTTTLEMEEEADVFAPFVESLGVRSFMGVMTYDVDVDAMAKDEYRYDEALREAQLRQAVEFAQDWHGRAGGRIQVMMTPNMTISSSPELLRASREAADRMGLRTSIHLGWGEYEVEVMQRLRGQSSFEYARDSGLLASDTVCAHCYVVGDSDTDVLAASRAAVAHCPLMNAVRGHIAPVVRVPVPRHSRLARHRQHVRGPLRGAAGMRERRADQDRQSDRDAVPGGPAARDDERRGGARECAPRSAPSSPASAPTSRCSTTRRFGLTPTLDPVQNLVYHAHSKDVELVMVDGNILVEDFELKTADARALINDVRRGGRRGMEAVRREVRRHHRAMTLVVGTSREVQSSEHRPGSSFLRRARHCLHCDGVPRRADAACAVRSGGHAERRPVPGATGVNTGRAGAGA